MLPNRPFLEALFLQLLPTHLLRAAGDPLPLHSLLATSLFTPCRVFVFPMPAFLPSYCQLTSFTFVFASKRMPTTLLSKIPLPTFLCPVKAAINIVRRFLHLCPSRPCHPLGLFQATPTAVGFLGLLNIITIMRSACNCCLSQSRSLFAPPHHRYGYPFHACDGSRSFSASWYLC